MELEKQSYKVVCKYKFLNLEAIKPKTYIDEKL